MPQLAGVQKAPRHEDRNSVPGSKQEVVSTDSLRKVGGGNRPIFGRAEFSCPEFDVVNKCASFDYQRLDC